MLVVYEKIKITDSKIKKGKYKYLNNKYFKIDNSY